MTPGDAAPDTPWHARTAEATLAALGSAPDGLTAAEAATRLARHGPNRLPARAPVPAWRRFLAQFENVLIYVLLGSAVVTALLGEAVETGVILAVVLVNALIGYLQEGRAERAMEAIRGMLAPQAVVVRDGQRRQLEAAALVPGDIVFLKAGDRVPADLRVLDAHGLEAEEAALTGEAVPVAKGPDPVDEAAALGDRSPMLFSGSLVTYGSGRAVVVATGAGTELGRITGMLAAVEPLTTPLLRQMAQFGRWLSLGILAVAAWLLVFGIFVRGLPVDAMFVAAVGLAVAAIPEGLPAIMTVTLAIGVTRMARLNAIVRRLPAVETLGALTVICSDKTGTLTLNEMTVQRVVTAGAVFAVEGTGYAPEGRILRDGTPVDAAAEPDLLAVARAGTLCNEASLAVRDGGWQLAGNPTDGALLALAGKAGIVHPELHADWPRRHLIPFDSAHKFMASLHGEAGGDGILLVKGAPERILAMCRWQRRAGADEPLDPAWWHGQVAALAADAMRVLALAVRHGVDTATRPGVAEVGRELTLLGLVGLLDPPRPEAAAAVARCREAGIDVKMITGDHAATAAAVAARLGLDAGRALTGAELDRLDPAAFREAALAVDVFARTTPAHKLRLVEALQAQGQVVAMTGDGVNDAPALKRADVGIAMGRKGTEAAKEAAEMVLADDRFATIARAVEAGRTVYDNLVKTVLFALPTNLAQALCILVAILLGQTLPLTPVQVLWVNMATGITLGLALAFEAGEADLMRRRPRPAGTPLLTPFLAWRTLFVALLLLAGTFLLFLVALRQGHDLAAARTLAVNAIVAGEMAYLLCCRRLTAPALTPAGLAGCRPALLSLAAVALLQLGFTYLPWAQALFGTASLGALGWAGVAAVGMAVLAVVELEKLVLRRYGSGTGQAGERA